MQDRRRWYGPDGGLGRHREALARHLSGLGYKPRTVGFQLYLAGQLNRWLAKESLSPGELTAHQIARFESARRIGVARGHGTSLTPILAFLRQLGVVPEVIATVPTGPIEEVLARYRRYLIDERGVSELTITHYAALARLFLSQRQSSRGDPGLSNLQAVDVITFVEKEARSRTVGYTKHLVSELRSLLRFFHREGLAGELAEAVPAVAGWRASSLPKGLTADQIDRLLGSCNASTVVGRRDLAILTLLARLGLRVGEVVGIELQHIDWVHGEVVIHGKGRRQERLPLPDAVGEALTAYILGGRPEIRSGRLFFRVLAPPTALSCSGVRDVVRQGCLRAGLEPVGAHRLRHGVATLTLAAGASLPEVGQLLRHGHLSSTAIYAKVDRERLRDLARPWPEARA